MFYRAFVALILAAAVSTNAFAQGGPNSVYIEELTWTEVRDAIAGGKTTVVLGTGGTEQNGPHMVLGKHNFIIHHTAGEIARRLGNALVAPVVAYVPEGNLDPPSGHMRYPGAITLPQEYYVKLLEYAVRSFRANGFKNVVLIGDSGGNQAGMKQVAETLNKEWGSAGPRVHFIPEYYELAGDRFREYLMKTTGATAEQVGSHAGMTDTSQLWYVNKNMIRADKRLPSGGGKESGVSGDPTKASPELGKMGIQIKVETTLEALKKSMGQ